MEAAPLFGLAWNEAEKDSEHNKGLLTIVGFDREEKPHAIGVGFVIASDGRRAIAVSAAHVFTELRHMQAGEPRHSRTALPEFLPLPDPIDIDRKKVRAMCVADGRPEAFVIHGLAFDERRDIAVFEIGNQGEGGVPMHAFEIGQDLPGIGDIVGVLSYGDLGIDDFEHDGSVRAFRLRQRPILRIGRVSAIHPEGQRLCRSLCIETTMPVFSGMSGGPVFKFEDTGNMRAFGVVCSDPDLDGPIKRDMRHRGASIIAVIPSQVETGEGGVRKTTLSMLADSIAGFGSPRQAG